MLGQGYGILALVTVANKGDSAETFNVTIYKFHSYCQRDGHCHV
jgi:hypothetical protein